MRTIEWVAHTLQQSLLPQALPAIPGVRITARYRSAAPENEVGGDFYDGFEIDENRWAIAIGDVSGKGAEAAAVTALARYTIRALACPDPGVVLQRLNEAVIRERDVIKGRFLTALFAVGRLEEDALALDVAVGGHPPPLVLRSDGAVEQVTATGPLIGLSDGAEYRAERVMLSRGEAMVLYTDGLTDARAPAQILSEADLIELLQSARGLEGERLAAFIEDRATAGHSIRDDIALVVIELTREADPASRQPDTAAARGIS